MGSSKNANNISVGTGGNPVTHSIGRSQAAKPSPKFKEETERTDASSEDKAAAIKKQKRRARRKDKKAPVNKPYDSKKDKAEDEQECDKETDE